MNNTKAPPDRLKRASAATDAALGTLLNAQGMQQRVAARAQFMEAWSELREVAGKMEIDAAMEAPEKQRAGR